MPLVKAQCTNCGATLEVDNAKDAAICPYCNTAYIVEKAINNYTTNIQAQNVTINANIDVDFLIERSVLISYKGNKTDIVIPDTVLKIGNNAFSNCEYITSVTIPESVKHIGNSSFSNCRSLVNILIPDSVEAIENYAFSKCTSLASITIPDSVTTLGDYAFSNCNSLTRAVIGSGVKVIGDSAFYGCKNLLDLKISYGVEEIGRFAFGGCSSLVSVTIPDSVTKLFDYAFSGCTSLQKVDKPKSTWRGNGVFQDCKNLGFATRVGFSFCYVATCVYGSYDCPQVWTLRRYRDDTLAKTWRGRAFIRTYYAISPKIVKLFGHTKWFKKMWRGKLDRMVKKLNDKGVENTPYQDKQW